MTKISSGSYDLNRWLHGGYDTDILSVMYGASGSGKTNFCLLAAVSQAKKGNKVIYIDTEGGFSVERVKQLAPENMEEVLGNIFLLKPTNFNEQKKAFEQLLEHLKKEVSLIIVDGMTILYRLDFASAREKDAKEMQSINSELIRQLRTLAEIARKREIPVLITNQVYRWEEVDKMVGGDILKYWAKCHIELQHKDGRRTAYLRKHRSLPEKSLDFVIVNSGIEKRGWI
ncbi:DNA repair and recombination protein RadB [Candidatus Pacearchaeota archaeon]|nr:DNA repair and recombination protein RadB [Candidatus Pacearchaeota archaeon]